LQKADYSTAVEVLHRGWGENSQGQLAFVSGDQTGCRVNNLIGIVSIKIRCSLKCPTNLRKFTRMNIIDDPVSPANLSVLGEEACISNVSKPNPNLVTM
jgi:hypothetical protein